MSDLISRDALIKAVEKHFRERCNYDMIINDIVCEFENIIDSIPAEESK